MIAEGVNKRMKENLLELWRLFREGEKGNDTTTARHRPFLSFYLYHSYLRCSSYMFAQLMMFTMVVFSLLLKLTCHLTVPVEGVPSRPTTLVGKVCLMTPGKRPRGV